MAISDIIIILVALLAVSEALALIPAIRANSVFLLIKNLIAAALDKLKPKK